ncbi:MAG TPA: hypothetical protein VHY57_00490 [Rhizomicrobium sp.]|nr:hypothetical protein [Rhizomicrobium sp.]
MGTDERFKIFQNPDGSVTRLPKIPVSKLRGMLQSSRSVPPTLDEMDEAIAAGIVDRFRRAQE